MTTKALYWIALGVFALGLNSEYRNGGLPLAHRVADGAEAVLCQVVTRAEQTLTVARVLTGRPGRELPTDEFMARHQAQIERAMALHQADLDRAIDLPQADFDRVQQRLDRMHMALDRVQTEKLYKLDRMRLKLSDATNRRIFVICPKTGERIAVRPSVDSADIDEDLSEVEPGDSF